MKKDLVSELGRLDVEELGREYEYLCSRARHYDRLSMEVLRMLCGRD